MTSTGVTTETRDTGSLMRQWRASRKRPEQVAAEMAAKITAGQMHAWEELSTSAELADEYDTSESTIKRAKRLLAAHGFMALEEGRYYVASAVRT